MARRVPQVIPNDRRPVGAFRRVAIRATVTWIALAAVSACTPAPNRGSAPPREPAPVPPAPALASVAEPHLPADAPPAPTAAPAPLSQWNAPALMGTSPEGNSLPLLPRFFTSLLRIAKGERSDHVRIAWLGDSHTQPDIWTQAVRRPLQDRFGVAGPGFIHVGWKKWGYRHTGVELSVDGQWRIEPPRLLTADTYEDGVLGLGGVRLVPKPGARAGMVVNASTLPGPARWELALRVIDNDAKLRIKPQGGEIVDVGKDAEQPGIRHIAWTSAGPGGGFELEAIRGRVELFGVVVEVTDKPGVALDVLGLNGARVVHALTWDAAAWTAALGRRKPDLIVLAYGTNEAGMKNLSMDGHHEQLVALLDRARSTSPDADCLIIGAMDRGGLPMSEKIERINQAQAAAAKDRGCAFWSAQAAMGGRGSMQKWAAEDPPMATSDHVHLKVRGYDRLGAMLARDMLRAFDDGQAVSNASAAGCTISDTP